MKKKILHIILITLVFTGQTCKSKKTKTAAELVCCVEGFSPCCENGKPEPCCSAGGASLECCATGDPGFGYDLYYSNKSNYNVDIIRYVNNEEFSPFFNGEFIPVNEATLEPGMERAIQYGDIGLDSGIGQFWPYCHFAGNTRGRHDSLRIYFNRDSVDERYVTYEKDKYKPRDIRNHEEYSDDIKQLYTFTNEDYNNAIKHQHVTPDLNPPVPDCDNRPLPPDTCVCYTGYQCVSYCD